MNARDAIPLIVIQVVISAAFAIIGLFGGIMLGLPASIVAAAAFCVFVAALGLMQIPRFIRATGARFSDGS